MRVVIATVQVPFVYGGAEIHAAELNKALLSQGHESEIVTIPFQYSPSERILDSMLISRLLDLSHSNGQKIDRLIALKFPAYLIPHHSKVIWLLHQHRQAYELWGTRYGDLEVHPNGMQIRNSIIQADNKVFAESRGIFGNSQNVVNRLKKFNRVQADPLYHPPQNAELFHCQSEEGYFFYPSRINPSKRQDLVIEALGKTKNPVKVIFAGQAEGDYFQELEAKIEKLGLEQRVLFLGKITEQEKINYYSKALAVIYPPYEEDYGYITLEGMLSSKPIVTCQDSGGPLEFVRNRETGLIAQPNAENLAAAIDELWENRQWSEKLGKAAYSYYQSLGINWKNVVKKLLA